jgi:hypothetical protein
MEAQRLYWREIKKQREIVLMGADAVPRTLLARLGGSTEPRGGTHTVHTPHEKCMNIKTKGLREKHFVSY